MTHKNGSYTRCPWTLDGRQEVRVQRHLCHGCGHSYSEGSALRVGNTLHYFYEMGRSDLAQELRTIAVPLG